MRSHILCLILPAIVSANGHVDKVMADGVTYQGYNDGIGGQIPVPPTVTWRTNPIEPGLWGSRGEFSTADVNCRFDGHSNSAYAKVKAGGELKVVWDYWDFGEPYKWPFPISAVLDYIADCHGDCDTIPVTSLLWNKLDHTGWTPNGTSQGIWAGETLIADNNTWTISIPSALAPGKYVIRHEAARLDEAYWDYGMEFYPNCINIDVEGTGTAKLSGGVVGTELYKIGAPGMKFNVYQDNPANYTPPGPRVIELGKGKGGRGHTGGWGV